MMKVLFARGLRMMTPAFTDPAVRAAHSEAFARAMDARDGGWLALCADDARGVWPGLGEGRLKAEIGRWLPTRLRISRKIVGLG
jgi:hypothetical protein